MDPFVPFADSFESSLASRFEIKNDEERLDPVPESDKSSKVMTKMIVRNLSSATTVESLNQLFSNFGAVRSISLATDVMTGRCGGFGFVHLYEQDIGAALHALNGKTVGGRVLRVTIDEKDPILPHSPR